MKINYDKKRKVPRKYKKGDLVLWKNSTSCNIQGVNRKLSNKYSGPYIVTKLFDGDRYKINSCKGMRGYKNFSTLAAVDSLRPYKSTKGAGKIRDDSDSDTDAEVRDTDDLIDLLES